MSNEKRKPNLDLEVCYSGFKVEELEYIGYSRTTENDEDKFLDTFSTGKLGDDVDGGISGDEEMLAFGEFESTSFSTEGYRSYLCSTPTHGRKHRGYFPQEADVSGFPEDYVRPLLRNDSGVRSRSISAANSMASFFEDEHYSVTDSLESLHGSSRVKRENPDMINKRKRIELDSDLQDPYRNVDELELSIEEEMSHLTNGSTSTLGTLKRRLSLKVFRRNISSGFFGSYVQQRPALPAPLANNSEIMTNDQAQLFDNKPTGPVNLWFRKFRNRHFI